MKEELEWLNSLTQANNDDKKRISKLHSDIFGSSIHLCVNCPDSLRAGVNRLKIEYINRYGSNG
tara:strand:- start:80 stop:271 length:192 start_codon:yes stop_codon:yes gene_type:complete